MAALTANLNLAHVADVTPIIVPLRASGAATFYRGGLVFYTGGQITKVSAAALIFAGVVAEQTITTAANQFVACYIRALLRMANATAFTIANQGALLYQAAAAASDNPADLTTVSAGNTGRVGRVIQVVTTAVDGYLMIDTHA